MARRLVDTGVLSPRQERILRFITGYIAEHGYAPSIRDIATAERLHFSSVAYQLTELEAAGKIMRDERVARSLRVVEQS
jgi:repressor LexA